MYAFPIAPLRDTWATPTAASNGTLESAPIESRLLACCRVNLLVNTAQLPPLGMLLCHQLATNRTKEVR